MLLELPPTRCSEAVVLGSAIVLCRPPLSLQLAVLLQTIERGKERSGIDVELIVAENRQPLGDAEAVHRLTHKNRQNHEIEGA